MRRRGGTRGFSALELVGVMCVISLVAFAIFGWGVQVNWRAHEACCRSNVKQIGLALAMYADDYGGRLPASKDALFRMEADYLKNWQLLRCSADEDPVMVRYEGTDYGVSYFLVPGVATDDPPGTVVAGDTEPRHHGTWNAVCVDGRLRSLPAKELEPYSQFVLKGKREHEIKAQGVHTD
ncbi:MAG: type II secretion system protein [Armatimonadetes bacterium]|nr:type II secretion system protein [Armatimonadota bacterium]